MIILQSLDVEESPSWTPVPDGYTVDRVVEILTLVGHTNITIAYHKVA